MPTPTEAPIHLLAPIGGLDDLYNLARRLEEPFSCQQEGERVLEIGNRTIMNAFTTIQSQLVGFGLGTPGKHDFGYIRCLTPTYIDTDYVNHDERARPKPVELEKPVGLGGWLVGLEAGFDFLAFKGDDPEATEELPAHAPINGIWMQLAKKRPISPEEIVNAYLVQLPQSSLLNPYMLIQ